MTDAKVTISRETLQSALDAVDPHFRWHTAIDALRAALAAQTVEPVAWRINTLEGVGLPANWHYFDDEPGGSAFTVQPLYVAPPSPADLIPQDKLFVCGQMGAHVTRVRVEQPAAVPPGYALVPIEPTQAILDAPFVGKVQPQDWHSHKRSRELMAENYRAMIAAAGDKP